MLRRTFISSLGAASIALPLRAPAQSKQTVGQRPIVAWLGSGTPEAAAKARHLAILLKGLEELGYVQGRDYDFVGRWAYFRQEHLPALAEELIRLKAAVIVASAVDTALAAKQVTSTVPIVSAALADAEHLGLVASHGRPGGNVTGITPYVDGLPAKQIELALEVVAGARRVGLLGNLSEDKAPPQRKELEDAGRALGLTVLMADVRGPDDVGRAVQALLGQTVEVVVVLQTTMMIIQRQTIALMMAANRLPAVYGYREHVDDGGLISYGVDLAWCWHRLATYVDKILKGASPGELPLEFPPKLQMVVNLKAAKALGLTVPPSLLARADEVIE